MKRTPRVHTRAVLALAAALTATLGVAAPAAAETSPSSLRATTTEDCFYNLDTEDYYCIPASSAVSARVTVAPLAVTAAATNYVYARLYENSNYGGQSLTLGGALAGGCGAGYAKTGNLPSEWNDRVSSFVGYLSCRVRLAEHVNQGGTLYGPYTSATSLGSFNDKASSYRLVD